MVDVFRLKEKHKLPRAEPPRARCLALVKLAERNPARMWHASRMPCKTRYFVVSFFFTPPRRGSLMRA
jgi:hypothetical protein